MSTAPRGVGLLLAFIVGALPADRASYASGVDTDLVNEAIERLGYGWVAAPNHLTRLPASALHAMFGAQTEPEVWGVDAYTGMPTLLSPASSSARVALPDRDLPASLDWRSHAGSNWVTPPKDQGDCGSCWDFAAVGAWESRMQIERGEPVRAADKSEQFILSCSPGTCSGGSASLAAGFVFSRGCPDESCFPYGPPYDALPCSDACPNWTDTADTLNTGAYLTTGYAVPTAAQVIAIKTALLRGPVATSMKVFQDFVGYSGGIYQYAWGGYLGGHGVVLVGWDDTTTPPCWIGKNSWGASWGEGGFFRIAIGEATTQIGSWTYEIEHYERNGEMQLCVEDTLDNVSLGSGSPAVWYGGVAYTMPVSGRIVAVMTRFVDMNMTYTVSLHAGISGGGAPGSVLTSQSGSFGSTLGWRRIDLTSPVHRSAGSALFAAIRYGTSSYPLPLESLDPSQNSGNSWYSSNGTTYAHLTSYGDLCIRVVVATASPAPPDTVENLTAVRSGASISLTWSPVVSDTTGASTIITGYQVFRSTCAHFDEGSATIIATPSGTSFTDSGAAGDPDVNYFYAVRALDDFGTPSALSRRVGEVDYALP